MSTSDTFLARRGMFPGYVGFDEGGHAFLARQGMFVVASARDAYNGLNEWREHEQCQTKGDISMNDLHTATMLESRNEPLSHSLEDYLEAIVDLSGGVNNPVRAVDVATKLDVSKASVSKAVSTLKERGYAEQPYYGDITLTDKGFEYGSAIWHKHKLLYRFLTEAVGIDPETANYEACQLEHGISADSFKKWETYLAGMGITSEK